MTKFMPPYGVPVREMIANGNADEKKAMLMVSSFMMNQNYDVDADALANWQAAHQELEAAVAKS